MRTFFGKPLRDVSETCHPEPLTLEEFKDEILAAIDPFITNMHAIHNTRPRHIEDWYETFLAWSEVEQAPNHENKS